MAIKATNRGTCQWCGRVQMLPSGRLAKHGYTKEWGFFNGICRGSGELPLEVSCDLVKQSIVWATRDRAELQTQAATERGNRAEVVNANLYLCGGGRRRSGYYWRLVKVTGFQYGRGAIVVDAVTGVRVDGDHDGTVAFSGMYNFASASVTVAQVAHQLHKRYAAHLESRVDELGRYIHHQTLTVQGWEPRPLLPLM